MDSRSKAVALFVFAVVVWGSIGIFVRYIPLSSGFIAFARGVIGSCFLLCLLLATRRPFHFSPVRAELPMMIATGAAIGVNWALLFEAYRHTTVAVATLCYYFAPIMVIVASPLVLRERLTPRKVACVLVALVGVSLVSGVVGPGGSAAGGSVLGVAFGLSAAFFYGANMLMNKLTPRTDPLEKTVIQLAAAAAVMVPYLLVTEDFGALQFTPLGTALLLGLGIVHTGIAYVAFFSSMRVLPAQTIAVLSYLDPATAIVLSALLLAEPLTPMGLLGAVLILGAAIASELGGEPAEQ